MKQFNNVKIYASLVKSCCQLMSAALKIVHLIAKIFVFYPSPCFLGLGLRWTLNKVCLNLLLTLSFVGIEIEIEFGWLLGIVSSGCSDLFCV